MSVDRRGLLVAGLGAAAVAAGARDAFAQAEGDATILESASGLEQVAVFFYQAAIDSGDLGREATQLAELFRDHEQQHADALGASLEALGGARPARPATLREADAKLAELGLQQPLAGLAGEAAWIAFAIELELASLAVYHGAHQTLQDAKLLQTATSIMANEGQHLVVLRELAGRVAVPRAFETGEPGQ